LKGHREVGWIDAAIGEARQGDREIDRPAAVRREGARPVTARAAATIAIGVVPFVGRVERVVVGPNGNPSPSRRRCRISG